MAAQNVNVCDIGEEVKETLKKFRFQKHTSNCALILKVNREKQQLEVDEELDDVQLEELQEILPSHQPRFIAYSYKMEHSDGRTSFPLCLIYYTPRDAHMELQVMYAGTQRALAREVGGKMLEARELDELTEQWLADKLRRPATERRWEITEELREILREKRRALTLYKANRTPENKKKLRDLAKEFRGHINRQRINYRNEMMANSRPKRSQFFHIASTVEAVK